MSNAALATLASRTALLSEAGGGWLRDLLDALSRGERIADVASAFAEAGRRVGRAPLSGALPGDEEEDLPAARLEHWSADNAARAAILLAVAEAPASDLPGLVERLYAEGDGREKGAIVRALVLLPGAPGYLPLATDAARSSDLTLFRAIACGNGYPYRYFTEPQWNALLMKVVFVDVPVREVIGLEKRRNPELTRMALDYVDERRAAGRPVPASVWDIVEPGTAGRSKEH